jgi:hypothetical protein
MPLTNLFFTKEQAEEIKIHKLKEKKMAAEKEVKQLTDKLAEIIGEPSGQNQPADGGNKPPAVEGQEDGTKTPVYPGITRRNEYVPSPAESDDQSKHSNDPKAEFDFSQLMETLVKKTR